MDDNKDNAEKNGQTANQSGEASDKAGEVANQAGQVGARLAADYFTGGSYEKIRNMPVVGAVAKKAEKKVGDAVENATKGGNIGAVNPINKLTNSASASQQTQEEETTEETESAAEEEATGTVNVNKTFFNEENQQYSPLKHIHNVNININN